MIQGMLVSLLVSLADPSPALVQKVFGQDVGVILRRHEKRLVQEVHVKDSKGKFRWLLSSIDDPRTPRQKIGTASVFFNRPETSGLALHSQGFQSYELIREKDRTVIRLERALGQGKLVQTLSIPIRGRKIDINFSLTGLRSDTLLRQMLIGYRFLAQPSKAEPLFLSSSASKVAEGVLASDAYFRSPFVLAHQGGAGAALIPDLDQLSLDRPLLSVLDLDFTYGQKEAPTLIYGFVHAAPSVQSGLVRPLSKGVVPVRTAHLQAELLLNSEPDPNSLLRACNSHLWARYGRPRVKTSVLPQVMPFETLIKTSYDAVIGRKPRREPDKATQKSMAEELAKPERDRWFEYESEGKKVGGCPWVNKGSDEVVAYTCLANPLRSAWGLRWWAKRHGYSFWHEKADASIQLFLSSPSQYGAFPTRFDAHKRVWLPGQSKKTFNTAEMAWTGYWLLRHAWDFPDNARVRDMIERCRALGYLLVKVQQPNGAWPLYINSELHAGNSSGVHPADSALPALFLAALANYEQNKGFREAALKGARFLDREGVDRRNYDSLALRELYGLDISSSTSQRTEFALAMDWMIQVFSALPVLDGGTGWKQKTRHVLDHLLPYQCIWRMPYRSVCDSFGSFGAHNRDARYQDACTAQIAITLLELGYQDAELFERGLAALRASGATIWHPFALANKVHLLPQDLGRGRSYLGTRAENDLGQRFGFDWAEGAVATAHAMALDRFGGADVDLQLGRSYGIDGLIAQNPEGTRFERGLMANPMPFSSSYPFVVKEALGKPVKRPELVLPLAITRIELRWINGKPHLLAVPGFALKGNQVKQTQGFFVFGSTRLEAGFGQEGFIAPIDPLALNHQRVRFEGSVEGQPIRCQPHRVYFDQSFSLLSWQRGDWQAYGDFINPLQIPDKDSGWTLSTGAGGSGFKEGSRTGQMLSPSFLATQDQVFFRLRGGSGDGLLVELVNSQTFQVLFSEKSGSSSRWEKRSWNIAPYRGQLLKIRITDEAKKPDDYLEFSWQGTN